MNTHTLVAISTFVATSALGAQKAPDLTPYLIADRAAEVALARTAAPSDISGKATVLVLTPKGYVEAARGTNGFKCINPPRRCTARYHRVTNVAADKHFTSTIARDPV